MGRGAGRGGDASQWAQKQPGHFDFTGQRGDVVVTFSMEVSHSICRFYIRYNFRSPRTAAITRVFNGISSELLPFSFQHRSVENPAPTTYE